MDAPIKPAVYILSLLMLLLLAGCSTANRTTASFVKSQQLRHHALLAASRGDTAQALNDIDQVRVLEPTPAGTIGQTPPYLRHPEHTGISPGWGEYTCNNVGINQFYCF